MSTIDSPAIGTATINAVSVDCPAKTNLTLHVGPSHAEWGGRHELDTIYCAVGVYDTVTATRKGGPTLPSFKPNFSHAAWIAI